MWLGRHSVQIPAEAGLRMILYQTFNRHLPNPSRVHWYSGLEVVTDGISIPVNKV